MPTKPFYDTKTKKTVYLPDVWVTGETDEALAALLREEPVAVYPFPNKIRDPRIQHHGFVCGLSSTGKNQERAEQRNTREGCVPAL
jgi:hypothetical protein